MNASQESRKQALGDAPLVLTEFRLPRLGLAFVSTLSAALLIGGCEKDPPPPSKPTSPSGGSVGQMVPPSTQISKPPQPYVIAYDLPIVCPPGRELIKDPRLARLSTEQCALINSAFYLWQLAVEEEGTTRAEIAAKIPVFPSPDEMGPDEPLLGVIKQALEPLDLKAAYVSGSFELLNERTGESEKKAFRFFTFRGIGADASFFGTVGALGHEFQHAVQGLKDDPFANEKSFQELARRELEAYASETKDLLKVAHFLRTSELIDPKLREKNLEAWLTDLAGSIHSAGYYSFRFRTQYFAATTSTSLERMSEFVRKSGELETADSLLHLRVQLLPLLQYKKDLPIDSASTREVISNVRRLVQSSKALTSNAEPKISARTESFLKSLDEFESSLDPLHAAKERLSSWETNPKPLSE